MTSALALLVAGVVGVAIWLVPAPLSHGRQRWLLPPRVPRSSAARVIDIAIAADLLSLALHSGCGVLEAIESVGLRLGGTTGEYLLTVAHRHRLGLSDAEAWAGAPEAWDGVARALRLASQAGVPPAAALDRAATDLRRTEQHRIEEQTARLGVQIVLPLGLTFLPAFVASTIVPIVLALGTQAVHP